MDLEFNVQDSRITALVVPSDTSLLQSLRGEKCGLVIPWEDVYRIGDVEEMEEIGYEDYFYGEGVTLIEWANLIEEILPEQ